MANHWGPKDQCIQEIYSNVRPLSGGSAFALIAFEAVQHRLRMFCLRDSSSPTDDGERGAAADGTVRADTGAVAWRQDCTLDGSNILLVRVQRHQSSRMFSKSRKGRPGSKANRQFVKCCIIGHIPRIQIIFVASRLVGVGTLRGVRGIPRILVQNTPLEPRLPPARLLPLCPPPCKLFFGHFGADRVLLGVDRDDISVLDERDRTADKGFGRDVTDDKASTGTAKSAVGDQRRVVAETGAHDGARDFEPGGGVRVRRKR